MRMSALSAVLLLACAASYASPMPEIQKRELMAFAYRSMGINAGPEDVKDVPSEAEIMVVVATGINTNGHLCANVVSVSRLAQKAAYEVICVAYRGGKATKNYIIDPASGTAFEQ